MKKKDIQELKNKSREEWLALLSDSKKKLHAVSLDIKAGKSKNVQQMRELKKKIARLMTFINI